jgi:sucrose-6-phosphate hydrolase SacC (GH32 family)
VFVDRVKSGNNNFNGEFPGRHSAPAPLHNGVIELRIVGDDCSVEVFADGGAYVITELIYPSRDSKGIAFFAEGGSAKVISAEIYPLSPKR